MKLALALVAAVATPIASPTPVAPLLIDQGGVPLIVPSPAPLLLDHDGAVGIYIRCSHAVQHPVLIYDGYANSWLVACEPKVAK